MKDINLKTLVIAFLAFHFSCSGSKENTSSTSVDTDAVEEERYNTAERELATNEKVTYENLFNEVEDTREYNIFTLTKTEDDLSVFVDLVEKAGLESSLMVADPLTVFIPTNEAFKQMPDKDFEELTKPENEDQLVKLLQTHILPAEVPSKHFLSSKIFETNSGERIAVDVEQNGTYVKIGGAEIVRSDVEVSNGIIHVVDAVLEPREFSDVGID